MAIPVTLALAKQQCGIVATDTSFDALLTAYIPAAIDFVENLSGHVLEEREITETFTCFGRYLELNYRPVISVDAIGYVDADGADAVVDEFQFPVGRYPVRIYPAASASWPTVLANSAITVTYTAGYDDAEWPQGLVQACLLLIAHWFAQRETVITGTIATEAPLAVSALCGQRRPMLV